MTLPATPVPAPVTTGLDIGAPLVRAVEWFAAAADLPLWTGFFIEVDPDGADGRHRALSLAGPIIIWTETTDHAERSEVDICSLIRGRTERARLTLERLDAACTHVAFTVTVLRPESEAALRAQCSRMASELAAARRILEMAA